MGAQGALLPGEVEWLGGELLHQVHVGQSRVDTLREKLTEVTGVVSRIKDNQELVLKQRRLLEGQQDAIFDMKQLASRVQSDNEAMRVEHAQLRKLKEHAAGQVVENKALEVRHHKQLEAQAELVAGVRQDLMALSAENTELRKHTQDLKQLQEAHKVLQAEKDSMERRQKDELMSLRKDSGQQQQQHAAALQEEADKGKRLMKEHRFKMLRTQQQQQQLEADVAEKTEQLEETREELRGVQQSLKESSTELQQVRTAYTELQEMFKKQREMHENSPAALEAQALQQKDEAIRALRHRIDELETTAAMQQLEQSRRDQAAQEGLRNAKAYAEQMEEEAARHRQHSHESGERADALAAKLAMAEASLSAKEELLKTRTERLRVLAAAAGNPTPPDEALPTPPAHTEVQLREELDVLRHRYSQLEQTAKSQLDKAFNDRKRLEAKVEELLTSGLDDIPD